MSDGAASAPTPGPHAAPPAREESLAKKLLSKDPAIPDVTKNRNGSQNVAIAAALPRADGPRAAPAPSPAPLSKLLGATLLFETDPSSPRSDAENSPVRPRAADESRVDTPRDRLATSPGVAQPGSTRTDAEESRALGAIRPAASEERAASPRGDARAGAIVEQMLSRFARLALQPAPPANPQRRRRLLLLLRMLRLMPMQPLMLQPMMRRGAACTVEGIPQPSDFTNLPVSGNRTCLADPAAERSGEARAALDAAVRLRHLFRLKSSPIAQRVLSPLPSALPHAPRQTCFPRPPRPAACCPLCLPLRLVLSPGR